MNVESIECPQCGAAQGQACHSEGGYKRPTHAARWIACGVPDARARAAEQLEELRGDLAVQCPYCNAAPGAYCFVDEKAGPRRRWPSHAARAAQLGDRHSVFAVVRALNAAKARNDVHTRSLAEVTREAANAGDVDDARQGLALIIAVDRATSIPLDVRMRFWEIVGQLDRDHVGWRRDLDFASPTGTRTGVQAAERTRLGVSSLAAAFDGKVRAVVKLPDFRCTVQLPDLDAQPPAGFCWHCPKCGAVEAYHRPSRYGDREKCITCTDEIPGMVEVKTYREVNHEATIKALRHVLAVALDTGDLDVSELTPREQRAIAKEL